MTDETNKGREWIARLGDNKIHSRMSEEQIHNEIKALQEVLEARVKDPMRGLFAPGYFDNTLVRFDDIGGDLYVLVRRAGQSFFRDEREPTPLRDGWEVVVAADDYLHSIVKTDLAFDDALKLASTFDLKTLEEEEPT